MLIYSPRYPGFGKQKLHQWGPISAVRSAVLRNAEELGANPEELKRLWACWAGGGTVDRDVIVGESGTLSGTASWGNGGIIVDAANENFSVPTSNNILDIADGRSWEIFVRFKSVAAPTSYSRVFATVTSAADRIYLRRNASDTSLFLSVYAIDKTITVAENIWDGNEHSLSLKFVRREYTDCDFSVVIDGHEYPYTGETCQMVAVINLLLGNRFSGASPGNLLISSVALFDAWQPAAVTEKLHDTPYQLFAPNPAPTYFDLEAGGGLVLGTNCGFVTETPTTDPDNFQAGSDGQAFALMHTSPAGNNKVTEIGFWQGESDNAAAEYNVGIYADDAGSPGALIATQSSGQSTTANTSGWYKYTGLSLSLTADTDYWISVGMEPVNPANNMDFLSAPGSGVALKFDSLANSTLLDPFEVEDGNANILYSIYAKYEAVPAKTQIFMHHYKMMAGA